MSAKKWNHTWKTSKFVSAHRLRCFFAGGLGRENCDYISNLLSSAHERNRTKITKTRLPRKNNNNVVDRKRVVDPIFGAWLVQGSSPGRSSWNLDLGIELAPVDYTSLLSTTLYNNFAAGQRSNNSLLKMISEIYLWASLKYKPPKMVVLPYCEKFVRKQSKHTHTHGPAKWRYK